MSDLTEFYKMKITEFMGNRDYKTIDFEILAESQGGWIFFDTVLYITIEHNNTSNFHFNTKISYSSIYDSLKRFEEEYEEYEKTYCTPEAIKEFEERVKLTEEFKMFCSKNETPDVFGDFSKLIDIRDLKG